MKRYSYWSAKTKQLDFEAMIGKLATEASPGDVVLLHACAHNPTGVDPSKKKKGNQWRMSARDGACFPFLTAPSKCFTKCKFITFSKNSLSVRVSRVETSMKMLGR